MDQLTLLKYPIGEFSPPQVITFSILKHWIDEIEMLPQQLKEAAIPLTKEQLDTPYRPGGWTLRQVIHHLPDSHMNAYIRLKLALTEEEPVIKPYMEDKWAECEEARHGDIQVSLHLLSSLHTRWVLFLRSLREEDFNKAYIHPEHGKKFILNEVTGMYAWHGKHHLHHILKTKEIKGWK